MKANRMKWSDHKANAADLALVRRVMRRIYDRCASSYLKGNRITQLLWLMYPDGMANKRWGALLNNLDSDAYAAFADEGIAENLAESDRPDIYYNLDAIKLQHGIMDGEQHGHGN